MVNDERLLSLHRLLNSVRFWYYFASRGNSLGFWYTVRFYRREAARYRYEGEDYGSRLSGKPEKAAQEAC